MALPWSSYGGGTGAPPTTEVGQGFSWSAAAPGSEAVAAGAFFIGCSVAAYILNSAGLPAYGNQSDSIIQYNGWDYSQPVPEETWMVDVAWPVGCAANYVGSSFTGFGLTATAFYVSAPAVRKA